MKLLFTTRLNCSLSTIQAGFTRELFLALAPPWVSIDLKRFDGCKTGDQIHLEMKQGGMNQKWVSHITHHEADANHWLFVDEGVVLPWPVKVWKHSHIVKKINEQESEIIDDIKFDAGLFGPLIYPVLWATFAIRPSRYRKFFKG